MPLPIAVESFQLDGQDSQNNRERNRYFTVIAASIEDAVAILDSQFDLREGSPYVNPQGSVPDPDMICLDISATVRTPIPVGGSGYVELRASHGYQSARGLSIPPLTVGAVPRIRVLRTVTQETVDTFADSTHTPITNAAGEPFDPPPTITVVNIAYALEWQRLYANQPTADASIRQFDGKINSVPYLGKSARCLYCEPVEVIELAGTNATGLKTYQFRAVLRHKPPRTVKNGGANLTVPGWDFLKPNVGRRMITRAAANPAANGPYREIRVVDIPTSAIATPAFLNDPLFRQQQKWKESALVEQPVPLNVAGDAVVLPSDMTWITGPLYDTIDFNGIGA